MCKSYVEYFIVVILEDIKILLIIFDYDIEIKGLLFNVSDQEVEEFYLVDYIIEYIVINILVKDYFFIKCKGLFVVIESVFCLIKK